LIKRLGGRLGITVVLGVLLAWPLAAQWTSADRPDLDAVFRIKDEGLQRSKVMEIESYLTDVYGPRLTGSPYIKEAADWAERTMNEWGLANVHREPWPFGRGWQNEKTIAMAVSPRA
jgi:carboxypeptidase Q